MYCLYLILVIIEVESGALLCDVTRLWKMILGSHGKYLGKKCGNPVNTSAVVRHEVSSLKWPVSAGTIISSHSLVSICWYNGRCCSLGIANNIVITDELKAVLMHRLKTLNVKWLMLTVGPTACWSYGELAECVKHLIAMLQVVFN